MTIGEAIQRVQSLYSKGVQSDDSRLKSRHIYNKLITVRGKVISQKKNKKQLINQWNYQTIPCIELEKAMPYECPCLPAIGCEILKTKYELPAPITGLDQHIIQSVSSLDGTVIYSHVTWNEKAYKSHSKYTAAKPDYYIRENYLYVTHKTGPKAISITGVFQDPLQVEEYTSLCDEGCTSDCEDCESYKDKDFHTDTSLMDTIIEMAAQELVLAFSSTQEDLVNNSRDSQHETSK